MNNNVNEKFATSYALPERLAPVKDALHLCSRMYLTGLPADAHMLCVGVGSGAEMIYLAEAFPNWRFTGVDPSKPMLEVCQKRLTDLGLEQRCTLHHGYLESLAESGPFDAATSILVSQFLVNRHERCRFFDLISQRLKKDGILISADIAYRQKGENFERLMHAWIHMHRFADMPFQIEHLGKDIAILTVDETERIISAGGFLPTVFYQSLFIHGWFCQKLENEL